MAAAAPKGGDRPMPPSPATPLAGADGLAAVAYVREHAADYGVDPHRIGIVGFSAGGSVTMNVATGYAPASRPDFVGVIYGPPPERPVPADAPPIFAAVAADDALLGGASLKTFQAWHDAGKSAELHVYAKGGHGFGGRAQGTPSDLWLEELATWLKFQGVAGAATR
jgi:acetyl esterase/lipase